ncbi:MAG: sulfotransferase, partial [Cyanobacteria bacterium J06627_8]
MNLFHCCVQKTASQWIRKILSEPEIKDFTGLDLYVEDDSKRKDSGVMLSSHQDVIEPFPKNVIVSPLYTNFENFRKIPKVDDYRAFFVMRDPRDLVVSWYFSVRYSHPLINRIDEI